MIINLCICVGPCQVVCVGAVCVHVLHILVLNFANYIMILHIISCYMH